MKRIIVVATVALLACSAPQTVDPGVTHEHKAATQSAVVPSAETNVQLAATARYQKIENALADGFVDINVFMPGMGYHFLNEQRLNATFDAGAPELLVYNIEKNGRYRLVAVEYAVPFALAANAPAGFTGDADAWDANQTFQLWTLHAWVWLDNPDGIFAPFNPRLL